MNRRRLVAVACAIGVSVTAQAQQVRTYTQSQTGPQFLTYGLPVPLPVESLTPVDGFRSYGSVQARLQGLAMGSTDLSAHDVGRSHADRTIWAYVASDEDDTDVEGRPEAAFFINASTHAREWGTPEVSTGTIERMMAGAGDSGVVRYLLDNTRLVIIPVQNADGVLQTQRYPTDVLMGSDPDFPQDSPRDGRMRRKNMRNVDEVLTTTGDHLFGIDLNRNHPPFWATQPSRSSSNPASIVHHGAGPHSEPENQAILAAARLGPETRIRLGIDLHTFSRVFFSTNTARVRLNNVQQGLISVMQGHQAALSGAFYDNVPDPANLGIGAAAEYFGYQWLVPSWTLELEPRNSAVEYGGTNVTHGGFILPASEARRVRESWAETHVVGFYRMAGPAHLARVRYVDVASGATAAQVRWQYNPQSARRDRVVDTAGSLFTGRRYRAELGFSKPMRFRNAAGQVQELPGGTGSPAPLPVVTLVQGATRTPVDVSTGTWINDASRALRYRDDTFAFEFTAPANGQYTLEVAANDMTGMNLDADPSSPTDWAQGAWSEYENVLGIDGDLGGADRSTLFAVTAAPLSQVTVIASAALAGEGDRAIVRVSRAAGSAGRLELRAADGTVLTTWAVGETGERSVLVPVPDNTTVDGDRDAAIALLEVIDGTTGATINANVRVLDNDDATRAVLRAADEAAWRGAWAALATRAGNGELVLDRGAYALGFPSDVNRAGGLPAVQAPLVLHANNAVLTATAAGPNGALFAVEAAGRLDIDALRVVYSGPAFATEPLLDVAGAARVARSSMQSRREQSGPLVRSQGQLDIARSGLSAPITDNATGLVEVRGGDARITSSSLGTGYLPGIAGRGAAVSASAGSVRLDASTVIAFPLVRTTGSGVVRAHRSLLDEAFDNLFTLPPPFNRDPCSAPLLTSEGANLFTAHYDGGSASDLPASGCIALAPSDRFDPTVAVEGTGDPEEAILFRPAADNAAIDVVDQCLPIDQRGAPRPQTLRIDFAPVRCDHGAYEAGVNPYRGIWSPARSGHGVDLQTSGNRLFLAWYTYEDDGEPTAYQAVAPLTGRQWAATLQQSSRNPQTGALTVRNVGNVTIDFTDNTHATLGWRFDANGTTGSEAITASLFAPGEPRFEVTGLWYPPAESGHGATISRRGEVTAVGVYYYDAQGNVRWALGTGSGADAQRLAMTSFRGFCPDCSAAANPVSGTPAGNALVHFHTPVQARVDLELVYPGAAGGTWARPAARFIPLNDPVDNTDALRGDPEER